jgi:DNA-binding response OmpR family regulator
MTAVREDADPATPGLIAGRILVVDDEPGILSFLGRALEQAGYAVATAVDAAEGVRLARTGEYGLVILDLVMPGMDGRAALAAILSERPNQAVMILSCADDVLAKVDCLDIGARDYLTKPFSLAELKARIRVQLRSSFAAPLPALPSGGWSAHVLCAGDLVLDADRLTADYGAGPVPLTRLEFLLLRALMTGGGELVTKSELLASVWGLDFDPGSNIVDVCIRRLRSKLGFALIETVRGEGYRLAC